MSCIVTSSATGTDVCLAGQNIDELALALVAPLGTEYYGHCGKSQHIVQHQDDCTHRP